MSYSFIVSEDEPFFYFPMTARLESGFPVDFVGNSLMEIEGFFDYVHVNDLLGSFLHLSPGSSAEVLQFDENLSNFSVVFWIFSNKSSSDIIDIAGIKIQSNYSDENYSIVANSSTIAQFLSDKLINIAVTFENLTAKVYVNSEEVYSLEPTFLPGGGAAAGELSDIIFGGEGELLASHISFFERTVSENEIKTLFNVGSTGSDIIKVETGSQISFSGLFKSHFQTIWQAYGIITTKK
jgi:hypothetical protein